MFGCLGGLLGWLGSRGRARKLVLGGMQTLVALGALGASAGSVALLAGQPWSVYYPLLLLGIVAVLVPLGLLPSLRRRYEEMELRQMRARDAF